jgi:multidrug efflux pump
MTSLATVLGTLPIALALGAGAKSRMPMGIVVIGGLMFSLVLTLYVVPAMYSFKSLFKEPAPKAPAKRVPAEMEPSLWREPG